MKRNIFDGVAGNNPSLNRFDLSYTNTTSMSFGVLYPVQCDEVYPGDVWKMSAYCHAELMPMVTPVMSDMQLFAHTFFVPYRLIYGVDNEDGKSIWEKFITGGEDGDYDTPLTPWTPSFHKTGFSSRTIWDSIGNPVVYSGGYWDPVIPAGLDVSVAPKLAYNFIYNNYYRDEFLVNEVDIWTNEDLLKAAFKKDYFTSALEHQQLGTAPALPVDISGASSVKFYSDYPAGVSPDPVPIPTSNLYYPWVNLAPMVSSPSNYLGIASQVPTSSGTPTPIVPAPGQKAISASVDGANFTATTFTVSDLRLAFAIQRMMELTQRSGYRYTEWLSAHYNAHPTDARLDRPEYIGGCIMNVATSPLTQNSETATTPQGTKTGIGKIDSVQRIGSYRVLEHGLIMTIVSIRPKPIYKYGINRQWLRQVKEDYYIPELAYLSEQGVYNAELYVGGSSDVDGSGNPYDPQIFGYQAHWNEMRCKNNIVSGAARTSFQHWTLARPFASRPALNQDFIEIDEGDFNQIFAVQNEDTFIVSWSNLIDAYRPIPAYGVPGLIDHVYGGR